MKINKKQKKIILIVSLILLALLFLNFSNMLSIIIPENSTIVQDFNTPHGGYGDVLLNSSRIIAQKFGYPINMGDWIYGSNENYYITEIVPFFRKFGNPTCDIFLEIRDGEMNNKLSESAILNAEDISTGTSWNEYSFKMNSILINRSLNYSFVLSTNEGCNSTDYIGVLISSFGYFDDNNEYPYYKMNSGDNWLKVQSSAYPTSVHYWALYFGIYGTNASLISTPEPTVTESPTPSPLPTQTSSPTPSPSPTMTETPTSTQNPPIKNTSNIFGWIFMILFVILIYYIWRKDKPYKYKQL